MKFLLLFVFSVVLALILGPFLPFYGLMIAIALMAALVGGKRIVAFAASGLGVGLVWIAVPMWVTLQTESELPAKIGQIMGLENPIILVLATGLLGFLIAGFSALTGNSFRKIFEQTGSPYYR
ncbi:hypothetical protein KIH41_11900 [Litoribacter ruber]|uniref:Uncharacterized protein n=1 Tax=Litoribacter ruber TaxID=702568 RepID=A0AAP2G1X0_9BACT|nr:MULTISPECIES: hypothetical protein [Litoribacter]MBS9524857.1 hypothetical protein [Litoribacter alkaliphilus]MBT0811983.1 hypothetical protein [Litoribacter ruber]